MRILIKSLLLVCLCILCAGIVTPQDIYRERGNVYSTDKLTASVTIKGKKQISIESVSTLTGKITVLSAPDGQVVLTYQKKSKADSKSQAIDYIDLIAVDLHSAADGARLQIHAPNPAPWHTSEAGIVEAELIVPEGSSLEINALYFDIDAEGPFTGVIVPSSLGQLHVSAVTEQLDISTKNRRIYVEDITGDISVLTSNASIEAREIESIDGQAVFRNEGGDIVIEGFAGEISIKNSYGRIDVSDFHPRGDRNIIRNRSGPIIVEIVDIDEGQVIVNNHYEDIDINIPDDISAVLTLAVEENDKIEVSGLAFQPDLVERNRLSLLAGEGEANIRCTARGSGNVYVRGIESR